MNATASFQWTMLLGLVVFFLGLASFGYGLSTRRPADRISACTAGIFLVILGIVLFYT